MYAAPLRRSLSSCAPKSRVGTPLRNCLVTLEKEGADNIVCLPCLIDAGVLGLADFGWSYGDGRKDVGHASS